MKNKRLFIRILAVLLALCFFPNTAVLAVDYNLLVSDGALTALDSGDLVYEGDTISDTAATNLVVTYFDHDDTNLGEFYVSYASHTVLGAADVSAADPGGDRKFVGWLVSGIDPGMLSYIDLTAYWEQAYRVTYHLNGGGGITPVDSNLYLPGEQVTLNDGGGLNWPGHTFLGWATESDATVALTSYYMDPDNTDLYAVWAAASTHTVTYDGNGSDGGSVPVDDNSYASGAEVTVLGNTGGLTRSGHIFSGWSNGTDTYIAGDTFIMGSADVTLYAVWTAASTYTVTYDGNGSDGGSVPVDGGSYASGAEVTVLGNTGGLTRSGYIFYGWSNGTNTYFAGDTFIMGSADVTLYAVWMRESGGGGGKAIPSYTLSYDGNGVVSGTVPASKSYMTGSTAAVSGNTGALAKSGYKFSGWNTEPDGSGTGYAEGDTLIMGSGNVVLYAQWEIIKIVYDKDKWGRYNNYNVAYSTSDGKNTIVPTSYYYEPTDSVLYKTPVVGTYDAMYSFVGFDDITGSHWASGFIWFLSARIIVNGIGNGLYDPEGSITRAQFIKMLACMTPGVDLSSVPSAGFLDVSPDDWYAKYIDWGTENNIVFGYGNGCFGPNDPITCEQMCCMIARYCRYLGYELGEINDPKIFQDQDSISPWAVDDVDALQKSGLIEGDGNNMFNPRAISTRAQAAAIACRLLMGILDAMVEPESIPCN